MLIRAVGRAAFLIVKECRDQFRDAPSGMARRSPTTVAWSISAPRQPEELIGPAFLAIMTPLAVGFLLGTQALGGFLAA